MTTASRLIEADLEKYPLVAGVHLREGLFRIDRGRLRAFYGIDADSGVVRVIGVHLIGR